MFPLKLRSSGHVYSFPEASHHRKSSKKCLYLIFIRSETISHLTERQYQDQGGSKLLGYSKSRKTRMAIAHVAMVTEELLMPLHALSQEH